MKSTVFRLLTLLMALLMVFSAIACGSDPTPPAEEPDAPEAPETPETPQKPANDGALDLNWHFGYVASDKHANTPDQLVENGDRYSYSDVFTVPKAGTTVSFRDDNTNSKSDLRFASNSAYVVSSWKEVDGEWVLDLLGGNIAGSNGDLTSLVESELVDGALVYSYTTYSDNEHLRLCFRSGQRANFTPEAFPKVTLQYTGEAGTAAEQIEFNRWMQGTRDAYQCEALQGLTVNALGDSYFGGSGLPQDQIWLNLWAKKNGMEMHNYGIGGSTVNSTGYQPMCIRYANMAANDADIVILEGGRNDFNGQCAIGDIDSEDMTTYMGAWNVLIDGVQRKYPNAMIVMISPWNFPYESGKTLQRDDYINAMRAVAEKQGVYFIDASVKKDTGVDMESPYFRRQYCKNENDVSHLNAEGMKLVMPNFDKLIAACYEDFLSKQ